jgi:septal ring factor EnvC (AmiA/AmiB activator)
VRYRLLILSLCALGPLAGQAPAPSGADLNRLEAERADQERQAKDLAAAARKAGRDAAGLRDRLVAAAVQRSRLEDQTAAAEVRLAALQADEAAQTAALRRDRAAIEDLLAALMVMERQRPPAIAVSAGKAEDAVRAAILMGAIAPDLETRARKAAAEISALTAVRAAIVTQRDALNAAEADLDAQRGEIENLLAAKREAQAALQAGAAAARRRAADLAGRAQSLRALIDRFAAPRPGGRPPADVPGFAQARGQLAPPAAGRILRAFGVRADALEPARGLTIATRKRAQVLAPFDATIIFAGPYRTYGGVLILDVGDDYLLVLTGLETLYGVIGQEVLAGEPVGEMADRRDPTPELYVELRRKGEPIDPGPWLAWSAAGDGRGQTAAQ